MQHTSKNWEGIFDFQYKVAIGQHAMNVNVYLLGTIFNVQYIIDFRIVINDSDVSTRQSTVDKGSSGIHDFWL